MTWIAGIVGNPVGQSLSPVIHNAWLAELGLDAEYGRFQPEDEAAFAELAARIRAGEIKGVNVTAPFKGAALEAADRITPRARASGSANILGLDADGALRADSTDAIGLLAALDLQATELEYANLKAVVLGAGGAARAAGAALKERGADQYVLNRSQDRAEAFARDFGARVASPKDLKGAGLVINALSIRPDIDLSALAPGAVVMDMTYRPRLTPFLKEAMDHGLKVVDGLEMLIGQAGPSFEAIFGLPPPPLDVRPLLLKALGETV